jgi:hypothetical protein
MKEFINARTIPSTKTLKSLEPNLVLDNEEIEVQVRFPRMTSFSAPESKNTLGVGPVLAILGALACSKTILR